MPSLELAPLERLTVLYDGACAVCIRCAAYLERSEQLVPLTLVDARTPAARARFGHIPWLGRELVCVDPLQRVWAGPAAFLITFYALARYRALVMVLCSSLLAPIAEWVLRFVSDHRGLFGWVVGAHICNDEHCGVVVSAYR